MQAGVHIYTYECMFSNKYFHIDSICKYALCSICMPNYICTYSNKQFYIYIYVNAHYPGMCIFLCLYVSVWIHMDTYLYLHTHTHTGRDFPYILQKEDIAEPILFFTFGKKLASFQRYDSPFEQYPHIQAFFQSLATVSPETLDILIQQVRQLRLAQKSAF